jgi:mycothiol system anti-sigma-R factor
MVPCSEVIRRLWDYLDGELDENWSAAIQAHLAECARCYPQYRFEFAFLQALARKRERAPRPPAALVARLRELVGRETV